MGVATSGGARRAYDAFTQGTVHTVGPRGEGTVLRVGATVLAG